MTISNTYEIVPHTILSQEIVPMQEMLVINPAVGCYYIQPCLPSQMQSTAAVTPVPSCLMIEAYVCEQFAHSHYMKVKWLEVKPSAANLMPNH